MSKDNSEEQPQDDEQVRSIYDIAEDILIAIGDLDSHEAMVEEYRKIIRDFELESRSKRNHLGKLNLEAEANLSSKNFIGIKRVHGVKFERSIDPEPSLLVGLDEIDAVMHTTPIPEPEDDPQEPEGEIPDDPGSENDPLEEPGPEEMHRWEEDVEELEEEEEELEDDLEEEVLP